MHTVFKVSIEACALKLSESGLMGIWLELENVIFRREKKKTQKTENQQQKNLTKKSGLYGHFQLF